MIGHLFLELDKKQDTLCEAKSLFDVTLDYLVGWPELILRLTLFYFFHVALCQGENVSTYINLFGPGTLCVFKLIYKWVVIVWFGTSP